MKLFFLNGRQHGTSPCCGGGPPEFQNLVRHFPRPGTRARGHCYVPEPALKEIATNLPLQGKAKSTRIMIYKLQLCDLDCVLSDQLQLCDLDCVLISLLHLCDFDCVLSEQI